MQRTPLYSYLEKVAAGDDTFRARLCQQLADRLIYVPIFERQPGEFAAPGQFKVRVVRIVQEDVEKVLLFTTEKLYKSWASTFSQKTSFISLLGGDFCAALQRGTSVAVDIGTAHAVTLDDEAVRQVAAASPDEIGVSSPAPAERPEEELRGRSEPTSFMQRPKIVPSGAKELPEPQEIEEAEQSLPASGLFAGAFAAGSQSTRNRIPHNEFSGDDASEDHGVSDGFAPGKRPVIFSPDSDSNRVVREKEDPNKKQRKSFLKFLKGS